MYFTSMYNARVKIRPVTSTAAVVGSNVGIHPYTRKNGMVWGNNFQIWTNDQAATNEWTKWSVFKQFSIENKQLIVHVLFFRYEVL